MNHPNGGGMQGDMFGGWSQDDLRRMAKTEIRECSCCRGNIKTYGYTLGSYVRILIWLYRERFNDAGGWCHIPTAPDGLINKGGDYGKLRHFGVTEQAGPSEDPKMRNTGKWRATELGCRFVLGRATVPRTIYWDRPPGRIIGKSDEHCTIREALGRDFDYGKLMRGEW